MRKHLAAVGLFSALAITGVMTLTLTLTSNDMIPVKEKGLRLSCLTPGEFTNFSINWFHPQNVKLSTCYPRASFCTNDNGIYNFTKDNNGAYAYINSLSRASDNGTWSCEYGDMKANIEIIVYSIPSGLSIMQNPDQDVDLSVNSIVLQCKTTGCTYPKPTVLWIFKDRSTSSETEYATVSPAGTPETCTSSEMVYTSTLTLPQYTTFNDNSDKTGTFFCRIEYPDTSKNIISSLSNNIRFAVQVRGITLYGTSSAVVSSNFSVVDGTPTTLHCETTPSRPAAVISWYKGDFVINNNVITTNWTRDGLNIIRSSLTFTPSNSDHGQYIYCQAYNINPVYKITSIITTLQVTVQVGGITLYDSSSAVVSSNLSVVDGTPTTLHCETTPSRPAAIITWYKGNIILNNNVITTNWTRDGLDIVRSSLTFTPSNSDHGQYIYCQAYNIDPVDKVTSITTTLQVTGAPRIPDISPDYKGYIGQYTIIQFGVYSNRDENLTITAQRYNTSGLIQQGIIQKVLPDSLKMYLSPEPDFRASIAIFVRSEYDFGRYLVKVTNNIGSDIKNISIDEQNSMYTPSVSDSAQVGLSVVGGVGIGVGCFVLGCIVTFIAFIIRRQLNVSKNSCFRSKGRTDDVTYSNTEMTSQPIKPIYEELNKGTVEHNMYDKITHSADGT